MSELDLQWCRSRPQSKHWGLELNQLPLREKAAASAVNRAIDTLTHFGTKSLASIHLSIRFGNHPYGSASFDNIRRPY